MIPGITDRNRLPRLAKIRLGEKRTSQGGKDYPAALDHFSFVDCPEVGEVYGKECKSLYPVLMPSDDIEYSFETARKAYGTTGLICSCKDGVTASRFVTDRPDQQIERRQSWTQRYAPLTPRTSRAKFWVCSSFASASSS